jgi:hypothetical protein
VGRIGQVNCASTFPNYFAAGPAHPYLLGRPGLNPVRLERKVRLDRKLFQELKRVQETLSELSGDNEFAAMDEELLPEIPKDEWYFGQTSIVAGDEVDLTSAAIPPDLARVTGAIKVAKNNSRLVVASIHAHEARRKLEVSDPFLPPFARACIDAGADAFFAAGPHVLRGIEIYKGKPIFYCLSNFLFQFETAQAIPAEDYATFNLDARTLDPSLFGNKIFYHQQERFWQSFVPRITYEDGKVVEIELHPLALGFGQPLYERGVPVLARGAQAVKVLDRLAELSRPYGTTITVEDGVGRVVLGEKT